MRLEAFGDGLIVKFGPLNGVIVEFGLSKSKKYIYSPYKLDKRGCKAIIHS